MLLLSTFRRSLAHGAPLRTTSSVKWWKGEIIAHASIALPACLSDLRPTQSWTTWSWKCTPLSFGLILLRLWSSTLPGLRARVRLSTLPRLRARVRFRARQNQLIYGPTMSQAATPPSGKTTALPSTALTHLRVAVAIRANNLGWAVLGQTFHPAAYVSKYLSRSPVQCTTGQGRPGCVLIPTSAFKARALRRQISMLYITLRRRTSFRLPG